MATSAYSEPGQIDSSFGDNGWVTISVFPSSSFISDLERTADGKILGLGYLGNQFAVARFNSNGSLDSSFGQAGIRLVTFASATAVTGNRILVQADGKILILGRRNSDFLITRLTSDGNVDSTFGTAGSSIVNVGNTGATNDTAYSAYELSDGRIVVVGRADTQYDGVGIVRLLPNGALDLSFGGTGKVQSTFCFTSGRCCYGTALIPDDSSRIVVAGYACVARFNSNGSIDTTFGQQGVTEQVGIEVDNIWNNGLSYALGRGFEIGSIGINGSFTEQNSPTLAMSSNFPGFAFESGYDNLRLSESRFVSVGNVWDGTPTYLGVLGLGAPRTHLFNAQSVQGRSIVSCGVNKVIIGGSALVNGQSRWMLTRVLTGMASSSDFDGDSKTDLSIFRPNGAASEWWWLKSSTGGNAALQFGSATDSLAPVDFTGDGKTDVAFWRPSSGQWFVLRSEDFSFYAFPFGSNGDVPVPGDFDGDGRADAAVFRPTTLTWYISKSSGGTDIFGFGASGDKPVVADYDGDGKADIAVFRPNGANGAEWWIRRSSNATVFATQFGSSTDKAVPADYTGDGKADIAFWTPSSGNWFVLRSEDFSYFAFPFGSSTDIPSPGDYDGDGKTDAAVFRPSNSTWYAQRSTAGILIQQFGAPGDVPVPSAYVR
ncbi:MAG: FG-GAP-like repeat-containing protein [Pyrinomonadaceae bacterium]|nr:FG-GAP-like repeat-containing protein [Pyrinomonadaceae bacterium]